MELKEFKERLVKQGVTYETFCERVKIWICPDSFVLAYSDFYPIIQRGIDWEKSIEGGEFWENVAYETLSSPNVSYNPPAEGRAAFIDLAPSGMTTDEFIKFFEKTTVRMAEICKAKNADYTGSADDDPFANFTRVEALGIASTEQGFLTRMTDKLCRIASFVKQGNLKVKDESVQDTLLDLANYSILMLAYLESEKNKKL